MSDKRLRRPNDWPEKLLRRPSVSDKRLKKLNAWQRKLLIRQSKRD